MSELVEQVSVDEISLEGIASFLWRVRRVIMVIIIVLLLVLWGYLLLTDYRVSLAEYRTAFAEIETTNTANSNEFSSANLDRVESGIYRLRVEVSGDHTAERRTDTPIDFDRDLEITVKMWNGLLLLEIANDRDDVIVQDVEIRGSLANRESSDFHQIYVANFQANLGHNETSRGVPISIFTTDNYSQLQMENWRWLADIDEFRENFKLHYMEVTFVDEDEEGDELVRLRYTTSTDFYEIRSRESLSDYGDGDDETVE